MYDLLIRGAVIVDGTGGGGFLADVGIADGRIAWLGRGTENAACRSIDAKGLVLSPGLIDMHGHSDIYLSEDSSFFNKLEQGITTEVCGQCGLSLAPVSAKYLRQLKAYAGYCDGDGLKRPADWDGLTEFNKYLTYADSLSLGANAAFLVGQGAVRLAAMGFDDRPATEGELETMKALTREAMESGAFGMSTGLIYAPGVFTPREELIELCKIVGDCGGFYASHIRNESDHVLEAVAEAIDIGRRAGVPVEISHCKISGRRNWGKAGELLSMVERANAEGVRVCLDQYPYLAGATHLYSALPPSYQEGGIEKMLERLRGITDIQALEDEMLEPSDGWDSLVRDAGFDGIQVSVHGGQMSVAQYARSRGVRPVQAMADLILDSNAACPGAFFIACEQDLCDIMQSPFTMFGTDAGAAISQMGTHPRIYGSFPRILGRYVREKRLLTLESAVRKMTGLAAQNAGIADRGLIRQGYWADLLLFDPDTIIDRAGYDGVPAKNTGIRYVFVNGELAVENGCRLGTYNGRALRRGKS